jgi:hypothetical protein
MLNSALIILTALIVLMSSACCIGVNELLKAASEKMEEDAAKEFGEIFEKYNIEPGDSTSLDTINYQDIDYTDIKKELADAANYPIVPQDEQDFFNNLEEIYNAETCLLVNDFFKSFKILYPSGYYTLVKATQKEPMAYIWFEPSEALLKEEDMLNDLIKDLEDEGFSRSNNTTTPDFNDKYLTEVNVALHEMTHTLSGAGIKHYFIKDLDLQFYQDYSYLIGNLIVLFERDKVFFSKFEIFEDIKNPDYFDEKYHDPNMTFTFKGEEHKPGDIDITVMLDELNAYTVSAKCAIATEEFIPPTNRCSARLGLLKQMSYLELYLKRCYEKHPEDWKYLTGHKGMAFLIMKLWFEAEKFENILKDDSRFNLDSEPVADFVYDPANYEIIEKLLSKSGILEYKDKEFRDIEGEFDNLTIYDINSL